MRQILLVLLFAGSLFSSCNGQTKNKQMANAETTETAKKENKMKTIHLNKTDFLKKVTNYEANPSEWKYLGDKPALIDFYADWCGPCKAIAPVLEELAAEYDGQIYIYKIDTEAEQELAAMFGIRSIPSLLFVPMEGQPQMAQGALPKQTLKEAIDEVLLNKKK
jgi:thioredoxin